MFKSKSLATMTIVVAAVASFMTVTMAHNAFAAGDDVFMDEGNGDFDSMPAPPPAAENDAVAAPAPAPTKHTAPSQAAAEPKAEEPHAEIPTLTDDAAPPAAAPAPTEDPAQPAAAEPKEKKAEKKKPKSAAKKAAKTADATPAPVAAKGQFVTTKDNCPMMRSPASTGETMLTVKPSRKIWVEDAGEGWVKAWNKAGEPGYVAKDCVQ